MKTTKSDKSVCSRDGHTPDRFGPLMDAEGRVRWGAFCVRCGQLVWRERRKGYTDEQEEK